MVLLGLMVMGVSHCPNTSVNGSSNKNQEPLEEFDPYEENKLASEKEAQKENQTTDSEYSIIEEEVAVDELSKEQYIAMLSQDVCNKIGSCSGQYGNLEGIELPSLSECLEELQVQNFIKCIYNPNYAKACLNYFKNMTCNSLFSGESELSEDSNPCERVLNCSDDYSFKRAVKRH